MSGRTEFSTSDPNYYTLLGVSKDCSERILKVSYRKAALLKHPDKNGNTAQATRDFQILLTAYNVLSDSFTRARYDEWLQAQVHDAPPMKSDDTTQNAYNAPRMKCGFCSNTQPKSTPPKSATPPTFTSEDGTLRYGTYHRAVKILRKRMHFVPTYTYEDLPEDYNKTRHESERAREQYEEDYSDRWDAMATKAERKTKKKDMAGDFSKGHRSGKGGRGNRKHAGAYDER